MPWIYAPHLIERKIPKNEYEEICKRAEKFSQSRSWYSKFAVQLRFRSHFCYIDGLDRKNNQIFPLCRLRYLNKNKWSLAFYTYSNDKYELCFFSDGETGSLEEAIEICEGYLQ